MGGAINLLDVQGFSLYWNNTFQLNNAGKIKNKDFKEGGAGIGSKNSLQINIYNNNSFIKNSASFLYKL